MTTCESIALILDNSTIYYAFFYFFQNYGKKLILRLKKLLINYHRRRKVAFFIPLYCCLATEMLTEKNEDRTPPKTFENDGWVKKEFLHLLFTDTYMGPRSPACYKRIRKNKGSTEVAKKQIKTSKQWIWKVETNGDISLRQQCLSIRPQKSRK